MSSTDVPGSAASVDMALETVVIPVTDVDAAKAFYEGLGWRLDADLGDGDFRIVQFNPPGSECSIQFGAGLTSAAPGSARQPPRRVRHRGRARRSRRSWRRRRGLPRLERRIQPLHRERPGERSRSRTTDVRVVRRVPRSRRERLAAAGDHQPAAGSRRRRPARRSAPSTSSRGRSKRAETAHGEHEQRTGERDEDWPAWYAAFMLAEQTGAEPPE